MDPMPRINKAPDSTPHLQPVRRKNDKQEDNGQNNSGKGQESVGHESGGRGPPTLPPAAAPQASAALGLVDTPPPPSPSGKETSALSSVARPAESTSFVSTPPTSSISSTAIASSSVAIPPSSTLQLLTLSPPQSSISVLVTTSDSAQTSLAVDISYEFPTTTFQSVPYQISFSRESLKSATTADSSESVIASETPTQGGFVPTSSTLPVPNSPNPGRRAVITAGIAVGSLGGLIIIAAIVFLFFRRRRRRGGHAVSISSELSNLSRRFAFSTRRESISNHLASGTDAGFPTKEWNFESTFAQPMPPQSLRSPNESPNPLALTPVESLSTPSILSIRKSFTAAISRFSFSTRPSPSDTILQLSSSTASSQTLPDPTPLPAPQPIRFQRSEIPAWYRSTIPFPRLTKTPACVRTTVSSDTT